jgi:pyridine nucleotide-disulfide oxidoreductase
VASSVELLDGVTQIGRCATANVADCEVAIVGAGPYGLSAAAYLRASGIETRIFGTPMEFWAKQMPAGMCLRSSWDASHIADPDGSLSLDAFRNSQGNHIGKPIPLDRFVEYGLWYQSRAIPDLDTRQVKTVELDSQGFRITLSDDSRFISRRVVLATGIAAFGYRPSEFHGIDRHLASHTTEHKDLSRFKGQRVAIVGGGQSALESAALLREAGAEAEVFVRASALNWVGLHSRLHHLGPISAILYSNRDVGPAGISRLVAAPHLFRRLPRKFQDKVAYRAIRPAGASWLQPRLQDVSVRLASRVVAAAERGHRLELRLEDGSERTVDHCLLATGFRVDLSRYSFLPPSLLSQIERVDGYPVLREGLESSVPGLHVLGKPASWSFGPLLCFVSGTEFAARELVHGIGRKRRPANG